MKKRTKKESKTWVEEIEIKGSELVGYVKKLINEGNVRRVIIRNPSGELLLEVPLTIGVVAGGAVTLFAPILAALGAMAALLASVKIEVIRTRKRRRSVKKRG